LINYLRNGLICYYLINFRFCPSVFFYLCTVIPSVWFLELDLAERRSKWNVTQAISFISAPQTTHHSVSQTTLPSAPQATLYSTPQTTFHFDIDDSLPVKMIFICCFGHEIVFLIACSMEDST
jgi:hypothetical protein